MKSKKNVPRAGVGENFNFFDFWKVFKTEGSYHIFTLDQLKYQNSLIWKKKMPKSKMQKKCPYGRGGQKLQFFRFFEKFSILKETIIFSL